MPRVTLNDPGGMRWEINTRQTETLLRAWFDEVLPWTRVQGRPGIDDFDWMYPHINVWPMWAWKHGSPSDPDWICDSRVLGRFEKFPAWDGESGLRELLRLRRRLEAELVGLRAVS